MKPTPTQTSSSAWKYISFVGLVGCIGLASYGGYAYRQITSLRSTLDTAAGDLASSSKTLQDSLATASTTINDLQATITLLTSTTEDLKRRLEEEQNKNEVFERQISKIAGTVGQLDKLSKTDQELLQKYSKVYFLNENYVPSKLSLIDKSYLAPGRTEMYFHSEALPYLKRMLEDAKDDDINLTIVSAYRSFDTQAELKGNYLQTYGSGANTFSADQGYSEHQLGTTIDFSTKETGGNIDSFADTKAFAWLQAHAEEYGFVLSYPKGNSFYIYEPWHWRFVGTDLAQDLHDDDAHFYDWDQRKIDTYLIKIFD